MEKVSSLSGPFLWDRYAFLGLFLGGLHLHPIEPGRKDNLDDWTGDG